MRGRLLLAVIGVSFCAGALVAGLLSRPAAVERTSAAQAIGTSGRAPIDEPPAWAPPSRSSSSTVSTTGEAIAALEQKTLEVPIEGADVSRWKGQFEQGREGHRHEAVDVLAPRNTPIHAVDDGTIAKLFTSKAGGLTIYERDPTDRFMYYYAHLERYADIHDGQHVRRGDVIGYVGTSGDAPADTPHVHFAIFVLGDPNKWWVGTPVDPYQVYAGKP